MAKQKRQDDAAFGPVARSAAMLKAVSVVRAVADKDVTLTLIGESGSGKEVLARRAHELSSRRRGPFVPINCAAIPDALFESEFFGHERGAFTGANERVRGKVESAQGGTLFLDEIGDMPMAMQAKLLRFLENRRYMRVGGASKIEADVRLMCATLRPLEQDVRTGRFRADLFYRIQGITLQVPALRERRADIAPLLQHFVEQLSTRHAVRPPRFRREAKAALMRYDWPGNVRELRNVVETLCLLRDGRPVRIEDLPVAFQTQCVAGVSVGDASVGTSITLDLDEGMSGLVRRIVEATLELEAGNTLQTAKRLKMSPRTVQRYLASGRVRTRT